MTAPAYTPRTITVGASREPTENPFAHYAPEYHAKGWNVVWLPPRAKRLTETGVTGHAGKDADANLIQRWIDQHPHANIGVRMPDDLIGIDVDQYGNKTGGDTLAQLEATLGPLPPTIISTSREDGVSGIRFYRVPAGRKWSGDAGKDIEIIQRVHRYAAVWPSVHPEGRIYYWHLDKGDEWERHDLVPTASRIAPLPEEWVAYLTESDTYVPPAERVHVTSEQARQILDSDDMCKAVRNAYDNAKQRMSSRNRHDGARDAVLNLTRLGEQGHKGAGDAVEALRADFIASVGRDRKGVAGEFERFVTGALGIVAATPTAEADKGCCGTPEEEEVAPPPPKRETPKARPTTLEEARRVFKKWLGNDYDTNALDAMLATLAAERLGGEPVWLLIISGSGNTKTTTVNACSGVGALVVSTITSEAALLSGTEKKSRAKDATGGLLREIGASGVLVIKDFTSILSMNRDLRAQVLGAFREIHDGSWVRKIGNEGGRSIPWEGRIAVIGAVTTAWDTHHSVIASMGDRFILLRVDSKKGRIAAGRQAIRNTDQEKKMQAELSAAVGGVIANMDTAGITLNEQETETVLAAADLVTRARTACEYDYQGNVIDAHAPEMPTRFAKELTQIIRGAVAVGMDRREALRLAIRCACDSMPPLRLAIIDDLVGNVESTTSDVQRRLNKPWKTVDRQLQSLNMLEVLDVVEKPWGEERHRWHYSLAADVHPEALNPELLSDPLSSPEKSVDTPTPHEKKKEGETQTKQDRIHTDKSGEHPPQQTTETQGSGDSCPSCDKPFDLPNPSCSAADWHGDGETP